MNRIVFDDINTISLRVENKNTDTRVRKENKAIKQTVQQSYLGSQNKGLQRNFIRREK